MPELTLVVRMNAKPGRKTALERALRAAVAPTHAEPGCLRYALHRAIDEPSVFVLVERWRSQSDLDEHMQTPHLVELLATLGELLAGPADVGRYELLPGGDPQKAL